jgi:RNA polymerase sigma factor (sigma-70 family)
MSSWQGATRAQALRDWADGDAMSKTEREEWFNRLVRVHGAALSRLAGSYTRSARDAEDLGQDIWLAIWSALPQFRGESSERTFLFRIAHNRGLAHMARRRLPLVEPEAPVEPLDSRPNPEVALAETEREGRLLAAVRQLPLAYRQVVTLALEGLSYEDMATVLGLTESNVGVRLTRARQLLRRELQGRARGD